MKIPRRDRELLERQLKLWIINVAETNNKKQLVADLEHRLSIIKLKAGRLEEIYLAKQLDLAIDAELIEAKLKVLKGGK